MKSVYSSAPLGFIMCRSDHPPYLQSLNAWAPSFATQLNCETSGDGVTWVRPRQCLSIEVAVELARADCCLIGAG